MPGQTKKRFEDALAHCSAELRAAVADALQHPAGRHCAEPPARLRELKLESYEPLSHTDALRAVHRHRVEM
jgi:hypothetical protein